MLECLHNFLNLIPDASDCGQQVMQNCFKLCQLFGVTTAEAGKLEDIYLQAIYLPQKLWTNPEYAMLRNDDKYLPKKIVN